jgi:hypothetical protein
MKSTAQNDPKLATYNDEMSAIDSDGVPPE